MRERINRLAKGILDMEIPQCSLRPDLIEETIAAGGTVKDEFYVQSDNHLNIKGLVYSSCERVTVLNHAFGGLRNRIAYEVDTRYLENGDRIEGAFYLVTNSGEKKIPYAFTVEKGISAQILEQLKEPGDFAKVAKEDMDLAMRLFEYQDFVRAPFMQDIRVRAVYDGLKGHGDRKNLVEEFMVALDMKKPAELEIREETRAYTKCENMFEDSLTIRKKGWGYVNITIDTDGGFIDLPVTSLTDEDFENGTCVLKYRICPERMHRGKNLGCISLRTVRTSARIVISAEGRAEGETSEEVSVLRLREFRNYMELRLDYESGVYDEGTLTDQMLGELEKLKAQYGDHEMVSLFTAEAWLMKNRADKAEQILSWCRDRVVAFRQEKPELYCFYLYLNALVQKRPGQKEALVSLLHQYVDESEDHPYLFILLLRLDAQMYDNPGMLLEKMRKLYEAGCCSPFLYMEACRLFNEEPGFLRYMDHFFLHALYFGARRNLIGEELAIRTAMVASGAKYYHRLFYRLLTILYESFEEKEILSAICCMLIKGEKRTLEAFEWYERGLSEGISLTRLYEYFLYSLPSGYDHLLPKEVLLYFSYAKELDMHTRCVLYCNILLYLKADSPIYKEYEREIEQFAMEQLFEARIDDRLAVIYEHMIYRDMIDVPVAKVLPAILKSYKIECRNPNMKYVIVRQEELEREDAFLLVDGVAFVPLFSGHHVLIFQDSFGNRYYNVRSMKTRVMTEPELEKRCFEVYPEHSTLQLESCRRIADRGPETEEEIAELKNVLDGSEPGQLYRKKIISGIIAYYRKEAERNEECDVSYLLKLPKGQLDSSERIALCETIIIKGYMQEAYDMIAAYGLSGVKPEYLYSMCCRLVLQRMFDQDELLLHLSFRVFQDGKADSILLDYLCEHFNGTTDSMYHILEDSVKLRVETYDLEERLLAQMMFTCETGHMDRVFELYVGKRRVSESLVKAFFTMKSMEFFLKDQQASGEVMAYLEGAVNNSMERNKIPVIYLLALTKYYSTVKKLESDQKKLCSSMMETLLENGMVFPYMKNLSRHIPVPEEIMSKVMIEYKGRKSSKPELFLRVLPEEEEFHREDLRRVYQGIFVRQMLLFDGEVLEYKIYDMENGKRTCMKMGKIDVTALGDDDSRFSCLNEMGKCLAKNDEEGLKNKMKEYLVKTGALEELFQTV
ncbi:DUF5717 family protein [Clostridium sp. AM58-1XD]|uniref:DUF5717 family protein n=1 Tax=Clostridium sp. AM58-1XD TaxID=2292307 RepID=UPI000E4979B4|nr:DUF5717 family protein [Clostridium sp. AM58-1XD]RGY97153.1 hypothetical protein DXA13_15385 [Clostridium sp. AM58-1XD]